MTRFDSAIEAAAKAVRNVESRAALIADVDLPEYEARAAVTACWRLGRKQGSRGDE